MSRFNFAGAILQESFTIQATGAAPNLSKHGYVGWVFEAFGDMQIEPKNK